MSRPRVLVGVVTAVVVVGAATLLTVADSSAVRLPRAAKAVTNPFTGQRAALILADTTLSEGTEVKTHYWIGHGGVEGGASHARVEGGVLPIYIDVPDCSPGWADSWEGLQFAVSAVPDHDFGLRVTESYVWPAGVCG